jgi:hypothetical protein
MNIINIIAIILMVALLITILIVRKKYLGNEKHNKEKDTVSIHEWDEQFEKLESLDIQDKINIYSYAHGYLKCNADVYEAINEAIKNEECHKSIKN